MTDHADKHRLMEASYAGFRATLGEITKAEERATRRAFLVGWMHRNREMKRLRNWLSYIHIEADQDGQVLDWTMAALRGDKLPEGFQA